MVWEGSNPCLPVFPEKIKGTSSKIREGGLYEDSCNSGCNHRPEHDGAWPANKTKPQRTQHLQSRRGCQDGPGSGSGGREGTESGDKSRCDRVRLETWAEAGRKVSQQQQAPVY